MPCLGKRPWTRAYDQGTKPPGLKDQLLHLLLPWHVGGIGGHHGAVQLTRTQAAPLGDLQNPIEDET